MVLFAPRRLPLAFALAGLALSSAPARSADQPPPLPPPAEAGTPDDGSAVVEALEVQARAPGPALWRVKRGESEVVILGGVTPLPHSLAWNTIRVDRELTGAKELLTQPRPKVGVLDAPGLLLKLGKLHNPSGQKLEAVLPPELAARFVKAREAINKPADRYAKWKPAVAGLLLLNDNRSARGLSSAKPGSTVAKLAEAKKTDVHSMGSIKIASLASSITSLTPEQNLACLAQALDQVDQENNEGPARSKAWAEGDLAAFRATKPVLPMESCLADLKGYPALLEEATKDATESMTEALQKPGRTVAVLDLNLLLRANGVLDRLRAAGAEISTPP